MSEGGCVAVIAVSTMVGDKNARGRMRLTSDSPVPHSAATSVSVFIVPSVSFFR